MDDLMRVHVMARPNELHHEKACFRLGETAAAAEHVHERTTRAKFECHVDILVIFKTFLEVDDVWMFKCTMNLDFSVQLAGYE
jgi:hypothetical protein